MQKITFQGQTNMKVFSSVTKETLIIMTAKLVLLFCATVHPEVKTGDSVLAWYYGTLTNKTS
jgi:hypothetical protein